MDPATWAGYALQNNRRISSNAYASCKLMWASAHSSTKPPAAVKAGDSEPRIIPSQQLDEASVAPDNDNMRWASLHHGAPLSAPQTCNHFPISCRKPLFGVTAISVDYLTPSVRLNWTISLYMWCLYRLAAGTATDMVHFPANFSGVGKVIDPSAMDDL